MPVTKGTSASSQLHALDILEATGRLSQQLVPIVTSSKLAQELNDGSHRDHELCRIAPQEGLEHCYSAHFEHR